MAWHPKLQDLQVHRVIASTPFRDARFAIFFSNARLPLKVTIPTALTARAALDLFEGFCLDGAQR
jgi:hypothetical protein